MTFIKTEPERRSKDVHYYPECNSMWTRWLIGALLNTHVTSFPLWGSTVNSVGLFLAVMFLCDTWMGGSNGLWILTYFSSFAEFPYLSYILRIIRYPGSILDSLKDFVTVRFGQFLIWPLPKSHTNLFYKAAYYHYIVKYIHYRK